MTRTGLSSSRNLGLSALLVAVGIWGASFPIVQIGLERMPLYRFTFFRFAIATAVLLPIARSRLRSRSTWRMPSVWALGVALFASFALQTEGLKRTSPTRSAFLTGLSVVLVPFIVWLVKRHRPTLRSWLAVGLAGSGLVALYSGAVSQGAGNGDVLSVLCAVGFGFHVVLGARVARSADVVAATAVQTIVVMALSGVLALVEPPHVSTHGSALVPIGVVLFSSVLATAVAFPCQLFAQTRLGPIETGIVLALEPVVAAVVSVLFGRDMLNFSLSLGMLLLVAAAVLSQVETEPPEVTHRLADGSGATSVAQ